MVFPRVIVCRALSGQVKRTRRVPGCCAQCAHAAFALTRGASRCGIRGASHGLQRSGCAAPRAGYELDSAACALISPETSRMARASWSAGCAPETAYFCAKTKVGTPEMPLSEASCACPEISATSSSVARRLRTSSASSPTSAGGLHQHVDVGEIAAVAKIQFHQPLLHLGGFALRFGPVDQPVAIDGVGLALDELGPVGQPLLAGGRDDAAGNALIGFDRAEFRGEIFVAADALAGHPGIEEERPPADLDRHIRHQRQRILDPALADIAPRADHVGDDVDLQAASRCSWNFLAQSWRGK